MIKIAMHSDERFVGLPVEGAKSREVEPKKSETSNSYVTPNLKMRLNNVKTKSILRGLVGHPNYDDIDMPCNKNLKGDSNSTSDLGKTFMRTGNHYSNDNLNKTLEQKYTTGKS